MSYSVIRWISRCVVRTTPGTLLSNVPFSKLNLLVLFTTDPEANSHSLETVQTTASDRCDTKSVSPSGLDDGTGSTLAQVLPWPYVVSLPHSHLKPFRTVRTHSGASFCRLGLQSLRSSKLGIEEHEETKFV